MEGTLNIRRRRAGCYTFQWEPVESKGEEITGAVKEHPELGVSGKGEEWNRSVRSVMKRIRERTATVTIVLSSDAQKSLSPAPTTWTLQGIPAFHLAHALSNPQVSAHSKDLIVSLWPRTQTNHDWDRTQFEKTLSSERAALWEPWTGIRVGKHETIHLGHGLCVSAVNDTLLVQDVFHLEQMKIGPLQVNATGPRCWRCIELTGRLQTCAKCRVAMYCSKRCQVEHWAQHKKQCASVDGYSLRDRVRIVNGNILLSWAAHRPQTTPVSQTAGVQASEKPSSPSALAAETAPEQNN